MTTMKMELNKEFQQRLQELETLAAKSGLHVHVEKAPQKKAPRAFSLTDRDAEIIRAVNRYRYMSVSQIQKLLFPENTTLQSTRKRLKLLSQQTGRYLGKIDRNAQFGRGSAETVYFLDVGGEALLRAWDERVISYISRNSGRPKLASLDHPLDLSWFRLKLELAIKKHPSIELRRFIADFERKEHATPAMKRNAYRLFYELTPPGGRKAYIVHPDGLILLQAKNKQQEKGDQRLLFVEIDRGTERHEIIHDKVFGYFLLASNKAYYQKFCGVNTFRVLIQTNSQKRAHTMREKLVGKPGEDLVWITDVSQVKKDTLLDAPIWEDHTRQTRSILRS